MTHLTSWNAAGRRLTCCLVLGASLLSGCSGSEATVATSRLPQLVLQPKDVGEGYKQFDEGRLAFSDQPTGDRADPARFGRVDGWKARYQGEPGSGPAAGELVESRADLFTDSEGAHKELAALRQELTGEQGGGGTLVPQKGLGNEAFVLTRPPLPGGQATFVTVAWRSANVTATVLLAGTRTNADKEAVRLARAQQERISRASQK